MARGEMEGEGEWELAAAMRQGRHIPFIHSFIQCSMVRSGHHCSGERGVVRARLPLCVLRGSVGVRRAGGAKFLRRISAEGG